MRTLKDYNDIFKNRENSTIQEVAEASLFFQNLASEFADRGKILKAQLEGYSSEDLQSEVGADSVDIVVNDDTYILKEVSSTKVEISEKDLLAVTNCLDPNFFEKKTVVVKDAVVNAYHNGTLPELAKPYVNVYTDSKLALRKKPRKKVK